MFSLLALGNDAILNIYTFVDDNSTMISMLRTCRYLYQLSRRCGYVKTLAFDPTTDVKLYFELASRAFLGSLNSLCIQRINDPVPWVPMRVWPRVVIFQDCWMGSDMIDPEVSDTECLIINNTNPVTNRYNVNINWNKFPKLRIMISNVQDINLTCSSAISLVIRNNMIYLSYREFNSHTSFGKKERCLEYAFPKKCITSRIIAEFSE